MSVDVNCEAAILKARLKHSWLENQVLNKSTEDVLYMRSEGDWNALAEQFPKRLREVTDLAQNAVEVFSPAQFVDQLEVFSHLPARVKKDFRHAVHSAYLRRGEIEAITSQVAAAAAGLETVLGKMLALWRDGTDPELRGAWAEVLAAASNLRDGLDALPKGIMLP